MARLFDGTDDFLQTSSNIPLNTATVTVALWLWWDVFSNNDDFAIELGTGGGTQNLSINPNNGSGNMDAALTVDTTKVTQKLITRPSAAAWHHIAVIYDNSPTDPTGDTVRIWIDGTEDAGSYGLQQASSSAITDKPVNFMSRNGTSLFGAGRLSEVGVWSVGLTEADIDALASGLSPSAAQPTGLVAHWPINCTSPEEEKVGGITAAVTGAICTDSPPLVAGASAQGPRQRQASGRMWRRWA